MSTGPIICGGDPPVPDTTSDCPQRDQHTPSPSGYGDWHEWAASMNYRGWKQIRCPGCWLFKVWVGGRNG